jgi:hypothetical protein
MSTRRRASELAVVLWLTLAAGPVAAQDRAGAEELFQLGKSAAARQDYAKACSFFQASLDAEFTLGTLLNLAICHEQIGKIASAWAEYRVLEDRARRAAPPQLDRAQFAQAHAAALRARLSRISIALAPEAAAISGLVVKIDDATIAPELFEAGVPVDIGQRTVTAVAPGHESWSQVVGVNDERVTLKATVPALRRLATTTPPTEHARDLGEVERAAAEQSRRTVGFVIGGVGVASLATGAIFGLLALAAAENAHCPAPCLPTSQGDNPSFVSANDAYQRADTLAWVSNVTLAAGVLAGALGAYLVLTTPARRAAESKSRSLRTALGITGASGGAGLTLGGDF